MISLSVISTFPAPPFSFDSIEKLLVSEEYVIVTPASDLFTAAIRPVTVASFDTVISLPFILNVYAPSSALDSRPSPLSVVVDTALFEAHALVRPSVPPSVEVSENSTAFPLLSFAVR